MLKYFFFSIMLGLMMTCAFAQNKMGESPSHKPTLTTKSTPHTSLEEQVKHLEMRLEQLKSRQPAPTAQELQKVEMRLDERRKALANEQAMKEKHKNATK